MATLSPYRYPGGKSKLLPLLMEYLDPLMTKHNVFVEPFTGGGSVLLEVASKYPNAQLFSNDKDPGVSAFWEIVAEPDDQSDRLSQLLAMLDIKPTVAEFQRLQEATANSLGVVERAYRAIFLNRCAFSGILSSGPIGGVKQTSKYTVDCRYNYPALKKKILACHELLAGRTTVSSYDVAEYPILCETNFPTYLDPPYRIMGDSLYPEKMSPADHTQLAHKLHQRSNWVLSYDDCPEIKQLYQSKQIIDVAARYSITGSGRQSWKSKNELIILPV